MYTAKPNGLWTKIIISFPAQTFWISIVFNVLGDVSVHLKRNLWSYVSGFSLFFSELVAVPTPVLF